jgi:hypothetical protein
MSKLTPLQATAPRKIWLQIDDHEGGHDEPFPDDTEGVTWCAEPAQACEVAYVREDIAQSETMSTTEALRRIEELLTNLQPHINDATFPGHAGFIDNYVDPALEIARAALAAAAPSPADPWLPIETAPRGTKVLLHAPGLTVPHCGDWGEYYVYNNPGYSHWMPLPAAPGARPAPTAQPVGEVRRAHPGGRTRSIGVNVAELFPGAAVRPGDKLYAAPMLNGLTASEMKAEDDEAILRVIDERDSYHEWADKLAAAISAHFGVDIGEHSNVNNPWLQALDAISVAPANLPRTERSFANEHIASETDGWPEMPPSKGQSPTLFEDGYAEGWARCLQECQKVAKLAAPETGPGLTDEQINALWHSLPHGFDSNDTIRFARAILAAASETAETASIAGLTEPERLVKCAECDLGCRGKCRKEPPLSPSGRFPGGLVGEPAVRVARITLDGVTLTVPADQLTALGLGEDDTANTYTLTFATMTRADFEALGEFDGF